MYKAAFIKRNFNTIKVLWDNDTREKNIVLNEIYDFLMKDSKKWDDISYNYFIELVNFYIYDNKFTIEQINNNEVNDNLINHQSNEIAVSEKSLFMHKLLMRAIRRKITALVEYLVNNGVDINKKNSEGEVPIILSAKYSNEDIVNILISKGVNVNEEDEYSNTPLFYAVKRKRISKKENIIKNLIKAGANVNKKDKYGKIPLTYLIERKVDNIELIKYFVSHGTNIDNIKINIDMSIFKYILKVYIPELGNIFYNNSFDINQIDKYEKSMLDYALEYEIIPLINVLIENGASLQNSNYRYYYLINAIDNNKISYAECLIKGGVEINNSNYEITPLNLAIHNNYKEIFICLINYGADVNQIDNNGDTPLTLAVSKNNETMAIYLIDHGADINQMNIQRETPLIIAISKKNKNIINYLIDHGADTNIRNKENKAPITYAIEQGDFDLINKLKEYGAELNQEDSTKCLLYSIKNNNENMAKYLISSGMDVNQQDRKEEIPLIYAIKYGRQNIVKYLVENGALLNKKCKNGKSPIMYAIEGKSKGILKYLIEQGADVNNIKINMKVYNDLLKLDEPVILEILLNNNFDMNQKREKGKPLIDYAIENENEYVVKYLIEHGADINRKIYKSNKIRNNHYILYAINSIKNKNRRLRIIEYLIEKGAEFKQYDENGINSILHLSIKKKDLNLIKYLNSHDVDIIKIDKDGKTPLIDAVIQGGNFDIMNYFLEI
eukprot:jgi/Orpsp1_1/1188575/evm.model.d7180000065834.1